MFELFDWLISTLYDWAKYAYDIFLGEENGFVWHLVEVVIGFADYALEQFPDFSEVVDYIDGGGNQGFVSNGIFAAQVNSAPQQMGVFGYAGRMLWSFDVFLPVTESFFFLSLFIIFILLFLFFKYGLKLIPLPVG